MTVSRMMNNYHTHTDTETFIFYTQENEIIIIDGIG